MGCSSSKTEFPPNPNDYPPFGQDAARVFHMIDTDGSGTLDKREISRQLHRRPKLSKLLEQADEDSVGNRDGLVDLREWLSYVQMLATSGPHLGFGSGKVAAAMLLCEMEDEISWRPNLEKAHAVWERLDDAEKGSVSFDVIDRLRTTRGLTRGTAMTIEGHVESELSRRVRAGSESSSTYEAVQAVMPAAAAREGGGKEGLITKEQFVDNVRAMHLRSAVMTATFLDAALNELNTESVVA